MGWQATVAGGTAAGVTEAGGAVAGVTEATPRSVDDAIEDLPPALRNAYRSYGLATTGAVWQAPLRAWGLVC